jgi:hypothetical protein
MTSELTVWSLPTRRFLAPARVLIDLVLPPRGQQRNVASAFRLSALVAGRVAGAHIVLVDDVFTTGATSECARLSRRAGAAVVDVVTLARVVRPIEWEPEEWEGRADECDLVLATGGCGGSRNHQTTICCPGQSRGQ